MGLMQVSTEVGVGLGAEGYLPAHSLSPWFLLYVANARARVLLSGVAPPCSLTAGLNSSARKEVSSPLAREELQGASQDILILASIPRADHSRKAV